MRDISDSSLIVRLTQGRSWIALLGALLFGIVALNVISLSLDAGNGRIGAEIETVERRNSALRAELAERFSSSRVEAAAAELGLAVPDPRDIRYMEAGDGNAEKLANLLGTDDFLAGEPTGYTESTDTDTYSPSAIAPDSDVSPSPGPSPSAPAPSAPASGGGGTGGTGGVGL